LKEPAGLVANLLTWWVRRVAQRPRLTLALASIVTLLGLIYTAEVMAINTDTSAMLDPRLPYRAAYDKLELAFPPQRDSILVALESDRPEVADETAAWLAARLGAHPPGIDEVYRADGGAFLEQNGLLLLPAKDFAALTDRLAAAEPMLATLVARPAASTLFGLIDQALARANDAKRLASFAPLLETLAPAIEATLAGEDRAFSWEALLHGGGGELESGRQTLLVTPTLDYGSIAPAGTALKSIREAIATLPTGLADQAQIYVTGSAALADEELRAATRGAGAASIISLVAVAILLVWGVRSRWLALASFITLVVGLLWTAAFAALAVGRLNLISVTFAVLFVGLGVDFSIHFALRFREAIDHGLDRTTSLAEAAAHTGPALLLCTVAAAIGFWSFVPTAYVGFAELGIIAGAGMFIAFTATLTLMPALLALKGPTPKPLRVGAVGLPMEEFLHRRAFTVTVVLIAVGCAALTLLPRLVFDENPINLNDQNAPSVIGFRHLASSDPAFSYPAVILATSLADADALATKLRALPDINRVITLSSFLPDDQETKLAALADLQLLMLPVTDAEPAPPAADPALAVAAVALANRLAQPAPGADAGLADASRRLADGLKRLASADTATQGRFQGDLFRYFPKLIGRLSTALDAEPLTLDTLPPELRSRWLAADGRAKVQVTATTDIVHSAAALVQFADNVRRVALDATGAAIGLVEGGRAVIKSMTQAGLIALFGLTLLLGVVLRRLSDLLFVLGPVLLAGLLTIATSILIDQPLNFANVIALPLLFGLGIASGTHLVMRAREEASGAALFRTSTPRATVFSALTTIASFASLSFSTHRGTQSMGILLAIAILWTLVATLVLLPALLELARRRRLKRQG
jgi:uncharacterized protein